MLSSISLRHMRVFVAVADHGTFTAAAEVLGLTPSGLTATIRQFEDVAGTPLFDRTTRQVTLSATGARFLPTARRLISEFEEALGDLDALSKGIGGTIRIAAAPSVLTRILPGVISRFVDEHPDARLRLDELNAGEVHEAVARNEADFGIAGEWHALPDIAFSPLFSDRFGVLCRPTHAFAKRSAIAWSELADQAFVGLGPESGTRAMMAAQGSFAGDA
ncbi:LysR family transcriptional regulator, partial [Thalassospira xianhensis MCCC 1A02616]